MKLTEQQRAFLLVALWHTYVSAPMFHGKVKASRPVGSRTTVTLGSAQSVLRRLARRGLLAQDDVNPAIFRITDAGREALS